MSDNIQAVKLWDRSHEFPEARKKIEAAMKQVMKKQPFHALEAGAMKLVITASPPIYTAATDGIHLFFNPHFAMGLDMDGVIFTLAHEVQHRVDMDMLRRQERDPEIWNHATDYKNNYRLWVDGFGKPELNYANAPNGEFKGLWDTGYGRNSAEVNYELLKKNMKPKKNQTVYRVSVGGQGTSAGGQDQQQDVRPEDMPGYEVHVEPGDEHGNLTRKMRREIEAEIRQSVKTNAQKEKDAGKSSEASKGALQSYADKMRADWRDLIETFISKINPDDATYARPKRKYLWSGTILPSYPHVPSGRLVICVDVSGSINLETFRIFMGQIKHIVSETKPASVDILWVNTRIVDEVHMEEDDFDEIDKLNPPVGGGTDFGSALRRVAMMEADAMIFFTDTHTSDFGMDPGIPTIWAISQEDWASHQTPPYGQVIQLAA